MDILNKMHFNSMALEGLSFEISDENFSEMVSENGGRFEDKTIPCKPHPYFIEKALDDQIASDFKVLHGAIEKVVSQYQSDQSIRDYLWFPEKFNQTVGIDFGLGTNVVFCRFDFALNNKLPQIYEFNAACPGGLQSVKALYQSMEKLGLINQLEDKINRTLQPYPVNVKPMFVELVKMVFERAKQNKLIPLSLDFEDITVGLLNSKDHTLKNELASFKNDLESAGIKCLISHIEDLTYDEEGVYVGKTKLDLCFHKFDHVGHHADFETPICKLQSDLAPYLKAIQERKVVGFCPFQSMFVAENKALMALLKDPAFNYLFEEHELKVIDKVLPETFVLNKNNLREFQERKNEFVLKKTLDTRGRSVIVGPEVTKDEWCSSLDRALEDNVLYIVQKFTPSEYIEVSQHYVTQASYLFFGEPVGSVTRSSTSVVTNVGKSGVAQLTIKYS